MPHDYPPQLTGLLWFELSALLGLISSIWWYRAAPRKVLKGILVVPLVIYSGLIVVPLITITLRLIGYR